MSDTPTNPEPLTFQQCLQDIEEYRDANSSGAAFKALLKRRGAQWELLTGDKQQRGQFDAFLQDPAIWNGENGPSWTDRLPAVPLKDEKGKPLPTELTQNGLYKKIVTGLVFTFDIMPNPFRAAFVTWVQEKPYVRDYLKSIAGKDASEVHYDEFRAKMLEAFGNDLRALGDSRMFGDKKNNTYVTQLSDGSYQTLDEDEVAVLLQKSANNDGPHIIITANHAFLETMGDLTPITKGYTDLVNEVTKGEATLKPFDQAHSNDTVMIAALQTRENNFLNLAQLFQRLYDVEMADKGDPRNDTFENVSPIAKMMVTTILKSIVEERGSIEIQDGTNPPNFVMNRRPLKLRADAPDIVRKAMFFGFSKGGNDFRDGMRLLVRTLESKFHDGTNKFEAAPGSSIWDVVSNISVTVQSMNEKPMHGYYRGYELHEDGSVALDEKGKPIKLHEGAAVTYFTNAHDTIAVSPDIQTTEDDRAVVYDGSKVASGHHPGVITENLYQHPYIMQHHRCVLAPTCGKPAIRFVLYQTFPEPTPEDPNHKRHGLVIKTSTGTTDKLFEKAIPTIEIALAQHGLGHVHIVKIPNSHSSVRYELRSKLGEDDLLSRGTIMKLIDAFDGLRDTKNGVVISSAVHYPNLSTLAKDIAAARWRFDANVAEQRGIKDWKDLIEITGDKVYDHNIAQANALASQGQTFYLPERWDLKPEKAVSRE